LVDLKTFFVESAKIVHHSDFCTQHWNACIAKKTFSGFLNAIAGGRQGSLSLVIAQDQEQNCYQESGPALRGAVPPHFSRCSPSLLNAYHTRKYALDNATTKGGFLEISIAIA